MPIVRYVNEESGTVALYESTSYYDPATKQSARMKQLEHDSKRLKFCIQKLKDTASDMH